MMLSSGGYRGVAMVSAETPSENSARPEFIDESLCLIKSPRVFSTGENLHSLAFEITIITLYSRLRPFFGLQLTARLKLSGI